MPVFRSAQIIIQNNTNDILSDAGHAVIRGEWVTPPEDGFSIDPQTTQTFSAQSEQIGIGSEGYIRLASTAGFLQLGWSRPWVGSFTTTPPYEAGKVQQKGHLVVVVEVDQEEPAAPVVVFNINEKDGCAAATVNTTEKTETAEKPSQRK